jgi:hypothetical protein
MSMLPRRPRSDHPLLLPVEAIVGGPPQDPDEINCCPQFSAQTNDLRERRPKKAWSLT